MRKYEEAMDHIRVTPEMRARILDNLRRADLEQSGRPSVLRFPRLKRLAALAACLALVAVGALSLPNVLEPAPAETPGALLPGGPVEAASAEELSRLAGFPVSGLEGLPFTPEQVRYTLIGDLAQIEYRTGEERLTFRKGPGTEDVSGDYTVYEWEETTQIGGLSVTVRGSGGLAFLAVWTDGTFSFSLSDPSGLEKSELLALISAPAE